MDTRRHAPGLGLLEPSVYSGFTLPGPSVSQRHSESDERFLQLAEALQDVVVLSSADYSELLFVNAAYEQIWGRPRSEMYANPMAFLDGVHPHDRDRVRTALRTQPGGGADLEFRVVRPDGGVRWVWARTFAVRDEDGSIERLAGIAEDITDRKRVLESHTRLIRGFTHDVKNPLGAADGLLSLLEMGLRGSLTDEQIDLITRARRSIKAGLGLIGQLLDIERAQSGQLQLVWEPFDLAAATREVVAEFAPAADLKNLSLALALPAGSEEALVLYSDRARVRQILANLISNGVKYTAPGGHVSVQVRCVEGADAPGLGEWMAVSIEDDGAGIPEDKQHLLFREFTRFNPEAAEGSGVGLAISDKLARALDGTIAFKSALGIGSTFTLWLPKDRRKTPDE